MLETFTLDLFHVPFTPFDGCHSLDAFKNLQVPKIPVSQCPLHGHTHPRKSPGPASQDPSTPATLTSLLLPSWFPQQLPAQGACAESAAQTPRSTVWRGELRRKYPETGQRLTQGNGVLVCHFRHRIRETLELEET